MFCGLPLFFALRDAGKEVTLANLSFTYLGGTDATPIAPPLHRVDASTTGGDDYFPERYLAEYLALKGDLRPVYAIDKVGVAPTRAAYAHLVESLDVDAVVLVDGGTDMLMRGDESGLGTPAEDMTSLAAVAGLDVPTKLLASLGFGIDAFHGVCHAQVLEAIADLTRDGGFFGSMSLLPSMPEVVRYREAVEYAHRKMQPSIVNASILDAVAGHFGDHHSTERTKGSKLFINPLMSILWSFDLAAVARRSLYLRDLEGTQSIWDVQLVIEAFRHGVRTKPRTTIPV